MISERGELRTVAHDLHVWSKSDSYPHPPSLSVRKPLQEMAKIAGFNGENVSWQQLQVASQSDVEHAVWQVERTAPEVSARKPAQTA